MLQQLAGVIKDKGGLLGGVLHAEDKIRKVNWHLRFTFCALKERLEKTELARAEQLVQGWTNHVNY